MYRGFVLISSLLVAVLLVALAIAFLSLSTVNLRYSEMESGKYQAKANALLAAQLAIADLQKYAGADQRVTAYASIFEASDKDVYQSYWLGVWSTTYEKGGEHWPLIGKSQKGGGDQAPYSREGVLQDLRSDLSGYKNDKWKEAQHLVWLVSGAGSDPFTKLDVEGASVVEMVGRGSLGGLLSDEIFEARRVLVSKVHLPEAGAYAWHISDNNQKAVIAPQQDLEDRELEASAHGNPAYVQSEAGALSYQNYMRDALASEGRILSYDSVALVSEEINQSVWRSNYHDFTVYAPGLFVDTAMSGLRYDLTPLLFAKHGVGVIDFLRPDLTEIFGSGYPIIPGDDHAVLGPSFSALRDWGSHRYTGLADAEVDYPEESVRMRPVMNWPFSISDGACSDAAEWAESAPKVHPVMTESRWHYYFSHHEGRVRAHIVPRVCLWNPYNRDLKIPDLSVLMPNPFYAGEYGMHFIAETDYVDNELKPKYAGDTKHRFTKWIKKGGYAGGDVYKVRLNPFPETRYLGFVLQGTTIKAGECHVFSPLVSQPILQSNGVKIQAYDSIDVSQNILSSSAPQGVNHFVYDHSVSMAYAIQTSSSSWSKLNSDQVDEIDFSRMMDYQPEVSMSGLGSVESFPFILKSGVAPTLEGLYTSALYPTLQLINHGVGGVFAAKSFVIQGLHWGAVNEPESGFGNLETFIESPLKDAARSHQVGAKLLWLDESLTEGGDVPYRDGTSTVTRWGNEHMVYNPCVIGNWNIRAQLTTRSPVSQCGERYYLHSTGPWIHQYMPMSPRDSADMPQLNEEGGSFIKNPFGRASVFAATPNVVLFDLPSEDFGVLSMASLRHAMLSPYSWNPSYIIGHSLRDLHAPASSTAYEVSVEDYTGADFPTRWDYLLGASQGSVSHGGYTALSDSQGLMQIGSDAATRSIGEKPVSSADEILAYDIAYEVNYYLWDRFFISSMPLSDDGERFDWSPNGEIPLWNKNYQFNYDGGASVFDIEDVLTSSDSLSVGFLRNAEYCKSRVMFNVNSTSVDAWIAFLSGTLGVKRALKKSTLDGEVLSFSRYRIPEGAAPTEVATPDKGGVWLGARALTSDEIRLLAENIVNEVYQRGPFVSLADFINRRLTDESDESSRMGVIDTAIEKSALNDGLVNNPEYRSTSVNRGSDMTSEDNNLTVFSEGYRYEIDGEVQTVQPASQAWGLPGALMQSDVLEPLAPSMGVRGDTFTIRCYGESTLDNGVEARVWLELVVERTPIYVDSEANDPVDAAMSLDYKSGELVSGNLESINEVFGRRFIIKSFRWLHEDEI